MTDEAEDESEDTPLYPPTPCLVRVRCRKLAEEQNASHFVISKMPAEESVNIDSIAFADGRQKERLLCRQVACEPEAHCALLTNPAVEELTQQNRTIEGTLVLLSSQTQP